MHISSPASWAWPWFGVLHFLGSVCGLGLYPGHALLACPFQAFVTRLLQSPCLFPEVSLVLVVITFSCGLCQSRLPLGQGQVHTCNPRNSGAEAGV